jgi:ABC-2 type transport system ATP-binding protein
MSENTIDVAGLRKRYGPTVALDAMTFTVAPGRVTGFVGPNGAGKSTTLRIILGLHRADAGSALIGGQAYRDLRRPLTQVGALLDASALHPGRTARNHLLWMAHSQGLGRRRVDEVVERTGLGPAIRRRTGGYSLGMRQRLGIAAALLGDPHVLLLDEPFNGMDPEGIVWMRGFLRELAGQGRIVLVSSHLMGEVQGVADHLVVVGRGRVIADAGVAELIATASGDRLTVRTRVPDAAGTVLTRAGATVTTEGSDALSVRGRTAEQVVLLLSGSGIPFSEVAAHRASLEEAYLQLTRESVEFRGAPGEGAAGEGAPGEGAAVEEVTR